MDRLDGEKVTRFILAVNGTIFLLLGLFGLFYHYLMAASCFLMATLLFISPLRSITNRSRIYLYLYYLLFVVIILLIILTLTGVINTYS